MRKPGCKDCKKRQVGCHSKCESYLLWQKEHQAELDRIKRIKDRENDIAVCTLGNSEKSRRAWKRNGSK